MPQSKPICVAQSRLHNPLRSRRPLIRWGRSQGLTTGSFSLYCSDDLGYCNESFRLLWTRYGVVCGSSLIPGTPIGGFLQGSGDHLKADLAGLGLRIEPEDVSQARASLRELAPIGEFARQWLSEFQVKTTIAEMMVYTTAVTVGVVVIVAICATGFGDALGLFSGAIGGGPSSKKDNLSDVFSHCFDKLLRLHGEP